MENLSERYGWLPSQIRQEQWQDIEIYLDIIATKNLLEKAENKKYGGK
ncbi:MAG: hypothetical protein NTZ18_03645 [Candidatus Komeilibacteria bacterium]|nr:hypothetical protein [Candidatus Komeilibacteria bacterium]